MTKKLLLLIAVSLTALFAGAQVCEPDPNYINASPGIYPDSLPHAFEGQGYETTITIRTLCDTSVLFSGIPVALTVQALKILDVVGQPNGFNFNPDVPVWTNPSPCTPITGCVRVDALEPAVTAAAIGVYPLTVYVDVLAVGNPLPSTPTWVSTLGSPPYGSAIAFSDYVLKVDGPLSTIETAPTDRFWVGLNYPNPANGLTNIGYNITKPGKTELKVYNMLGALVYSNVYQAEAGKNIIAFDASKFGAGLYVYTVSNGRETITRKMTIN
ncbi:MAG: T9SS type A sorting domain-containing protein [Sphingobacteriales bacterium JAD_PAG50586_3]|nr:MAG: T9SS type A sorting domain-containing protein [Sphingobacteriales bacterium JAD_PAG50586_3]